MSDTQPGRARRMVWTVAGTLALVAALPLAVFAAHSFVDVPDSNVFHSSIEWMKSNGVTVGCNPPANTQYCPDDNVTREQMASFMRRFAQTQGSAGADVTDTTDPVAVNDATPVELLSVDATPTAEASVVLNAHVTLERETGADADYEVFIAQESCTGTKVAATGWTATPATATSPSARMTLSLTGSDLITADTSYVLCAAETAETGTVEAHALQRGLNATWQPTA